MLSEPLTLYKLMILYMLKQVKFPLSYSQISEFFLSKEYTTYFTLQQAINELLEAHLMKQETIRNSSRYEITREGEEALVFFGNNISEGIVADMDQFLRENKIRLRNEVGVVADYYKSTTSDIVVQCEVREGKGFLIQLNISVPSEKQAEIICDNWQDSNQKIYSYVMSELLKNRSEHSEEE
ncbi:MAG: DUF4364 family protein [Lachnospiraceae bacterium]|nr:DUF4364 family protein [Lachnospiraceae bacterium]